MKRNKIKRLKKKAKRSALNRSGWNCAYCGNPLDEESVTLDHVIPKCEGGRYGSDNIVAACKECNNYKADYFLCDMPLLPIHTGWLAELERNSRKHPAQ